MNMIAMSDLDLNNKRVLLREDLNVPLRNGIITSDQRIQAVLPTIKQALAQNAAVILLSHLGRPQEGLFEEKYSLKLVAEYLSKELKVTIRLEKDYLDGIEVMPGEVVLCENVRFNVGEKANDETLSKKLAALCDIFVMDAFGTAHRDHASTYGVVKFAPVACAGPLLMNELNQLSKAFKDPESPIIAIVGGAKVSSKLGLLSQLINQVDTLIVGGGIANTLLKAKGFNIGASLFENDLVDEAKALLEIAGDKIPLATDVVVAKNCTESSAAYNKNIKDVADDDLILDIGPQTIAKFSEKIRSAKTVIWNGPVGVFECAPFSYGTRDLAFAIAESDAYSIAGGGDTLAAIDKFNLAKNISYISTGGGAFLEYMEGVKLPAVKALEDRALSK